MNNTILKNYFRLIKGFTEQRLEQREWLWSSTESLLIDWCVMNLEADHDT
ncbi:MAG: hypothetical protein KC643_31495 [Nitrospira sp.]|nr:hypothetical protein [Nitrospira sp.]